MTRRLDLARRALRIGGAACALAALGACASDDEARLAGERLPVLPAGAAEQAPASPETRPIPPAISVADWTHVNGDAAHSAFDGAGHVAAPAAPRAVWSVDAGAAFEDMPAPGQPAVAGGRVFVRDGEAALLAFDAASGAQLWRVDLTPEGEDPEAGFGGGVVAADGRVYATTGFGEALALDPRDGRIIWRRRVDGPVRVAPAAANGRVFVVTRANTAHALNGEDGAELWRMDAASARAGALAGAPPATLRSVVVLPFGSGELTLARASGGLQLWTANLAAGGLGASGLAAFPDVTSAPVIVGTDIYAGGAGAQLTAIDGRTGRRKWTRAFGALSPVWPAGDSVFVASTEPALMRLDAQTGRTLWRVELPGYADPDDREGPIAWRGPILAGGRLLTVSSDGRMLAHDPVTGAQLAETRLSGGAYSEPLAAGGAIYVHTADGRLTALR
ncbi:PQQ-binding-like beta-propeller repeat protein [Oceanicella actignis]|uniref:outer membrane protein assembly factor BamB family protein n=1 Tax=Oceanicella actignis TaxID=1189325 RepID=UPI0011E760B2|nr:PQQ-binding-like beta-propeller repeat protein [Oceanicella actignis]TYO89934.1 outer membrane protein assembly factor BamB [Oceanicella actignis]